MKQRHIPPWVGAIMVQLQNGLFYYGIITAVLSSLTLWALAGPSVQIVLPWVTYWHFLGLGVIGLLIILVLDYIFIYPVRQRFINEQACKHVNPAMIEILKHTKWIKQIADHFDIDLENINDTKAD